MQGSEKMVWEIFTFAMPFDLSFEPVLEDSLFAFVLSWVTTIQTAKGTIPDHP